MQLKPLLNLGKHIKMKRYTVQITSLALADMEEIYSYIAVQLLALDTAIEQYNRIADAIEKLNVFPERIKVMDSEPEHSMGLRRLTIDNYSVFYVIRDYSVIVTRVLYSASDISKRLLE